MGVSNHFVDTLMCSIDFTFHTLQYIDEIMILPSLALVEVAGDISDSMQCYLYISLRSVVHPRSSGREQGA
jgi:hypothetical protein